MNSESVRKPNRQQVAAAATRREIVLAARRLFGQRGYAPISIADIADEAGVSIPTIYASVGPKHAIVTALVELVDFAIGGDDARSRVEVETDPLALIAFGARINRALQENFGDILAALRSAAEVEPAVAEAVANGERMHRFGAGRMVERLSSLGALRPDVTTEEATDVICLLTDPSTLARLVGNYGWTYDRAEAWMNASLSTLLLSSSEAHAERESNLGDLAAIRGGVRDAC